MRAGSSPAPVTKVKQKLDKINKIVKSYHYAVNNHKVKYPIAATNET